METVSKSTTEDVSFALACFVVAFFVGVVFFVAMRAEMLAVDGVS